MIDRSIKNTTWAGVYTDNYNGAYESTEALIKAGFTEIGGFFSDMNLNLGKERYKGFKQALQDNNIEEMNIFLKNGPAFVNEFYEITCRMTEEGKLPKAIFLSNGVITSGFFKAIIEKGIVPGRDIHVISFDYLEALDIARIPYSYLKRNCKLLGQTAVNLLKKSIHESLSIREECFVPATLQLDSSLNND